MSLASNFARGVKVELIAKLAKSYEAFDGGTIVKHVAPHNIRDYFRKYGSTARKFDQNQDGDVYIGYVRMSHKPEFLSAIVLAGDHAIAVSFDSETDESSDFLTLMAKKEFADRINAAVERAAAYMRKTIAPPPVAPPAAPQPTVKTDDNSGWWALLIIVGLVLALGLIMQLSLRQTERDAAPSTAGFSLQDSYDVGGSDMPPHVRDFSMPNSPPIVESVPEPQPDPILSGAERRANSLSPSQTAAVDRWRAANLICRGSSDPVAIEAACASREEIGPELEAAGLCYGHQDDRGGVDFIWHVCEAGSDR